MRPARSLEAARVAPRPPARRPAAPLGRRATFGGESWERDASRRADEARARGAGSVAAAGPAPDGRLDPAVQESMEAGFGHDFSRVRVFSGAEGDAAQRLDARAVTADGDVFFAPGEYATDAQRGHEVLAHELAHVVQRDQGAPPLAFRFNERDLRRVERAMRSASRRLAGAVRYLQTPDQQHLLTSIANMVGAFFPRGHGVMDESGAITSPSASQPVELPVTVGNYGSPRYYMHHVTLFVSAEQPLETARYTPNDDQGEIRIFGPNVLHASEPQLAETLTHELVHLFTHMLERAHVFANNIALGGSHAQAAPPADAPGARRALTPGITLADATLHGNAEFGRQAANLGNVYEPVIAFVNGRRVARGAQPLVPSAVADTWVHNTARELLAYVFVERVNVAQQLASGRGRGRVAIAPPALEPLRFFRVYAADHWLDDPQDRVALRSPEAEPFLRTAGASPQLRAVYDAIVAWVDRPPPPAH
ncbi:MAG TPA: DUF4157 domain-containing protein [Myxococcota bacterium]|nr:DUF4157 domain-containing protein [Myxococcota bacterium]